MTAQIEYQGTLFSTLIAYGTVTEIRFNKTSALCFNKFLAFWLCRRMKELDTVNVVWRNIETKRRHMADCTNCRNRVYSPTTARPFSTRSFAKGLHITRYRSKAITATELRPAQPAHDHYWKFEFMNTECCCKRHEKFS